MAYFLRKEKKKKGTYLQMYESFWDKDRKQPRTKNVTSFGYVEDLISDEIPDPIKFYSDYVKEQNENRTKALSEESRPRAFSNPVELNIGHFLLYSLIDELDVKETIDILASQMRFQFSVFDLITQLIYVMQGLYLHALSPRQSLMYFHTFMAAQPSLKTKYMTGILS